MKRVIGAILVGLLAWCGSALAQGGMMPGPGTAHSVAASYSGPGDIVSGGTVFYSCARVYNAAKANTSTNMCDLVAVSGGAAVCTLRGSSSGLVDLTAYCPGSLTPSAACAAASGGACMVHKVYNQVTPGTLDLDNSIAAGRDLTIAFSGTGSLNGLPGMGSSTAAATVILTSGTATIPQPYTYAGVVTRTSANTGGILADSGGSVDFAYPGSANTVQLEAGGSTITGTVSDSHYHGLVAVTNGNSSIVLADGTSVATGGGGNPGALGFTTTIRIARDAGGNTMDGTIMEIGIWPSAFNATQYGNMDANQRSTNGYCAVNGCTLP